MVMTNFLCVFRKLSSHSCLLILVCSVNYILFSFFKVVDDEMDSYQVLMIIVIIIAVNYTYKRCTTSDLHCFKDAGLCIPSG